MAIGALLISASMMNGFEDCSHIDRSSHTVPPLPRPDNCADDQNLLARDVFAFLGYVLFIVPIAPSAVIYWNEARPEIEPISLSN